MIRERKVKKTMKQFEEMLLEEGKSEATCEKYIREATRFLEYTKGRLNKNSIIGYKETLIEDGYSQSLINTSLSVARKLLEMNGVRNIKIKNIRTQRSVYMEEGKMLTKEEYVRLLNSTEQNIYESTRLIIETICSTGIRVSELKYFTVEQLKSGEISIYNKGKVRKILLPVKLREKLNDYADRKGIDSGCIFRNSKKRPLHRSQIWQMMKRLSRVKGVDEKKVFPHALRKLFAREFYEEERDIAKLADILGHSSINTTRIYIATTSKEHLKIIERLELII